jgi:hypothetical protein
MSLVLKCILEQKRNNLGISGSGEVIDDRFYVTRYNIAPFNFE